MPTYGRRAEVEKYYSVMLLLATPSHSEFHLRMTLALIFPLSAKCFKQQPFHGALGTMHHSLGAIAVWPWERPSPHSHDLLFEANVCL